MKRREALAGMIGALAGPLACPGFAQEAGRVRVVGYLMMTASGRPRTLAAHLKELGYVEGRNLRFELRHVPEPATTEELDRGAMDLARSGAEVLVTQTAAYTTALHRATKKIPIVTYGVSNPVSLGLARSLRNPGMNVTGLSFGLEDAAVLQFGVLRLLRPRLERILFLAWDSRLTPEHLSAAGAADLTIDVAQVQEIRDFERAFAAMGDPARAAAWIVDSRAVPAKEVATLAIRYKVATHGQGPGTVKEGLLVSCSLILREPHRRVATLIDKILRGTHAGTIPFEQPDKSEIALNQATARAIGVAIPDELKLRATEIFG